MSALDKQLSDSELNRFLRQALLEREDDALLTQLTDMEAAFVFSAPAMAVPTIAQEQLLVKKLGSKFAGKTWMKWMWPGAGTAGVAGIAITVATMMGPKEPPKHAILTTPVAVDTAEVVIEEPQQQQVEAPLIIINDDTLKSLPEVPAIPAVPAMPPLPAMNHGALRVFMPVRMIIPVMPTMPVMPIGPVLPKAPNAYQCRSNDDGEGNRSTIDTTFTGVKKLIVDGLCSDVAVKGGETQGVSVKGSVTVETKGAVRGDKLDYVIKHKKDGDVLRVWVENSKRSVNMVVVGKIEIDATLHFVVPKGIDVEVNNQSGDILMEGLSGTNSQASAVYGDIQVQGISGDVKLSTQSGDITLHNLKGNGVLESTYGDQEIRTVTGNISSENASGDVTIHDVTGDVSISSTYGDVSLFNCSGKVAKISLASGKTLLTDINFLTCKISSTYGNIEGVNVKGNLNMETSSGDVRIDGVTGNISCQSAYGDHSYNRVSGNIAVNSASGNINMLNIAGNANVNSTYGNLTIEEFKGDLEANVVSGNVKGLRVTLLSKMDLTSTSGDIKMHLMNSLDDLSFDLSCDSGSIKVEKDGQKLTGKDNQLTVKKGEILIKATSSSGNQSFN